MSDVYALRHLLVHLSRAGAMETACALLADPAWLSNKLRRLGIQPILADYETLGHGDATLDLIGAALTLAAPALARNPTELPAQLLARLAPCDADGLGEFLGRVQRALPPFTLVPSRPTFTSLGAELRRFEGRFTAVTGLADGRHALSGSEDGMLQLWDLETGIELRRFKGHEGRVASVAGLPDGRRAVSASQDGTLRLWDLETGSELTRLTFDATTTALAWVSDRVVVGDVRGGVHVIQLIE